MFKKHALKIVTVVSLVAASATQALAVAVLDTTAVGTAVTAELAPALAAAMPIAGTILAVTVGWKLFKRFAK